jgi:hypothetical protein
MEANQQSITLKQTRRYILINVAIFIALSVILVALLIIVQNIRAKMMIGLFLFVLLPGLIGITYSALYYKIILSPDEFIFSGNKRSEYRIPWNLIMAVEFSGNHANRKCIILTEDGYFPIPFAGFDEAELKCQLLRRIGSSVFDPLAYQKLNRYQSWRREVEEEIKQTDAPIRIGFGKLERIIGFLLIAIGILIVGFSLSTERAFNGMTAVGLFFIILGIGVFFSCTGHIEADTLSISVIRLFSRHTFKWPSMQKVFIRSSDGTFVLVGDKCRLIIPPITTWYGKDEALLLNLITLMRENANIEPESSFWINFWWSRNC